MENNLSEQELIARCRKNDVAAFEQLIGAYEQRVFALAFGMLGNRQDAEDMTQDIFLKVFRSIHTFRENASFSTWVYRVATNVCLDEIRRRKKRSGDVSINQTNRDDEAFELALPDPGETPFEAAQKKEAMAALREAIDCLGEEQRAVVVMRDLEGLSYEEIAHALGTSLGTIKSRLNRARQTLRRLLENKKELFM